MTSQSPAVGGGLTRLRVDLAYDGTNFAGWAKQAGLRTVQGEVERVLGVALRIGEPVEVTVAGRTDAGVHARGQVLHADVPAVSLGELNKLTYSLNGLLPADVRIHEVSIAPEGFDARFAAVARRYSYAIADGRVDPLTRGFVVAHWRRLDVQVMNEACEPLIGLHDFTTFCKRTDFGTSIRTLQEFWWERTSVGVVAHLKADAFCHSMVRSLVGALVLVGEGRRPVEFPAEVLARRQRTAAVVTMPGHGLVLEQVYYPPADQLAARQAETRARRDHSELAGDPNAAH